MQGGAGRAPEVFGRDSESMVLRGLVAADRRVGALLLAGAAGIGKTALWEAGLEMARAAGRFQWQRAGKDRLMLARERGLQDEREHAEMALEDYLESLR